MTALINDPGTQAAAPPEPCLDSVENEAFIKSLSHDLRSPIITILGYLGHLRQGVNTGELEEAPHLISRIEAAAQRMYDMISGLDHVCRIGRQVPQVSEVELPALVRGVWDELAIENDFSGIKFTECFAEQSVSVDPHLASVMVKELLLNAIRFGCPDAAGSIEAGSFRRADGGITVYIEDHGLGIASESRDDVFGCFNQVTKASQGIGVGLTIAHRIAKLHQAGARLVESEDGGVRALIEFAAAAEN